VEEPRQDADRGVFARDRDGPVDQGPAGARVAEEDRRDCGPRERARIVVEVARLIEVDGTP
jgi:hypothetical protein